MLSGRDILSKASYGSYVKVTSAAHLVSILQLYERQGYPQNIYIYVSMTTGIPGNDKRGNKVVNKVFPKALTEAFIWHLF